MIRDIYSIERESGTVILLPNSYKNHHSQRVNGGQTVLAFHAQFILKRALPK